MTQIDNAEVRLLTIRHAHKMPPPDALGAVTGFCSECDRKWPCPTYLWTFDPNYGGPDILQPWEPSDWDPPRDDIADAIPE